LWLLSSCCGSKRGSRFKNRQKNNDKYNNYMNNNGMGMNSFDGPGGMRRGGQNGMPSHMMGSGMDGMNHGPPGAMGMGGGMGGNMGYN
jgi:hypothetical protein